jgi:hypothetical protein
MADQRDVFVLGLECHAGRTARVAGIRWVGQSERISHRFFLLEAFFYGP